eukprot:COSAG06_NODE_6413_length_2944_cov_2.117047_4_plen_212_part_00
MLFVPRRAKRRRALAGIEPPGSAAGGGGGAAAAPLAGVGLTGCAHRCGARRGRRGTRPTTYAAEGDSGDSSNVRKRPVEGGPSWAGAQGASLGRRNAQPLRTSHCNVAKSLSSNIALLVYYSIARPARNHAWLLSNNSAKARGRPQRARGAPSLRLAAASWGRCDLSTHGFEPRATSRPQRRGFRCCWSAAREGEQRRRRDTGTRGREAAC